MKILCTGILLTGLVMSTQALCRHNPHRHSSEYMEPFQDILQLPSMHWDSDSAPPCKALYAVDKLFDDFFQFRPLAVAVSGAKGPADTADTADTAKDSVKVKQHPGNTRDEEAELQRRQEWDRQLQDQLQQEQQRREDWHRDRLRQEREEQQREAQHRQEQLRREAQHREEQLRREGQKKKEQLHRREAQHREEQLHRRRLQEQQEQLQRKEEQLRRQREEKEEAMRTQEQQKRQQWLQEKRKEEEQRKLWDKTKREQKEREDKLREQLQEQLREQLQEQLQEQEAQKERKLQQELQRQKKVMEEQQLLQQQRLVELRLQQKLEEQKLRQLEEERKLEELKLQQLREQQRLQELRQQELRQQELRQQELKQQDLRQQGQQRHYVETGQDSQTRQTRGHAAHNSGIQTVVFSMETQGYFPGDISIKSQGGSLRVAGSHVCGCEEECFVREFERSISLPGGLDTDTLAATLDAQGHLRVTGTLHKHQMLPKDLIVPVQGLNLPTHMPPNIKYCPDNKPSYKLTKMDPSTGQTLANNSYKFQRQSELEDDDILIEVVDI